MTWANMLWRYMRPHVAVLLATAVLLALWEGITRFLEVPEFILPRPSAILRALAADIGSGVLVPHLTTTFVEVVAGFLLAAVLGLTIGCLIGLVPLAERILYPYVLAFQTIPKVAIAPLMIIWFGFGIQSKIITATLVALFPIVVNVMAGLKTVEPRRLLLMQALAASPWQTFWKLRFPSMLPYFFAGLEVGILFAVIGALVGEFLGSAQGLGSVIIRRQSAVDVAGVFSVLVVLSSMGIVLNVLLRRCARHYASWAYRGQKPGQGHG